MVVAVFSNIFLNPRTEILVVLLESVKFLPNQTAFTQMKWYSWHSSDSCYILSELQSHSCRHIFKSFVREVFYPEEKHGHKDYVLEDNCCSTKAKSYLGTENLVSKGRHNKN